MKIGEDADPATFQSAAESAIETGRLLPSKLAELLAVPDATPATTTPEKVFGGRGPNVLPPSHKYSKSQAIGRHKKTGQPVTDERGRPVVQPSEMHLAKAGVLLKRIAQRAGIAVEISEHEIELLAETFAQDRWCGKIGGVWETDLPGSRAKTILDESGNSAGLEVVPIFFDDAVITFPLLSGELYPFVDVRNVPRGRRVEGASIGNPTLTWGTAEGTTLTEFDTDALVAAIDTTIYPVTAAITAGIDFLADAAVDVGQILVANIGQRMAAELDYVIAVGNGTSQPQGIANASGMTDIGSPAGGGGATPQIDDYETLMFSVGKQYRSANLNMAFVGTDTTYRRIRAVSVGAADARRVFGLAEQSYSLFSEGVPFKIQGDIGNANCYFGALKKYRMYRRLGMQVNWTREGKTLALDNEALLTVRGRFGGRVVDANAFSYSDNWKA